MEGSQEVNHNEALNAFYYKELNQEERQKFIYKISNKLGVTAGSVFHWISGRAKIRKIYRMQINQISRRKIFSE